MRWSIVRLIWARELRDQLRDRRTVMMIAVLPLVLYPLLGVGLLQFAAGAGKRTQVVGVVNADALPLFDADDGNLNIKPDYLEPGRDPEPFAIHRLDDVEGADAPDVTDDDAFLDRCRRRLRSREYDLVVVAPPDFARRLGEGGRPALRLLTRDNDEFSRVVEGHFTAVLGRWKKAIREKRLAAKGLPPDYGDPFEVRDPDKKSIAEQAADDLVGALLRVFPFILVMWSLAGALYPAVDLCAGEKERGTMETLLISPASREEIVWGKFLTIWVFSAATALLNLLSMGLTAWALGNALTAHVPGGAFRPEVLFWSALLVLPLSAFYSAVSLAVGAYARSSKEGQYYLMPLLLLTMPLVAPTLAGVELNPFNSMVPVTGVALLLQRLISPEPFDFGTWLYFVPVLAPMVIYSWLALWWAVAQFRREEVLFREAERLEVRLWLRRLFREKGPLPTAAEALFCFGVLWVLNWLSSGVGRGLPLLARTGVAQLAFVAAPPLLSALLLTTRPRHALGLRAPPAWSWPAAVLLAVLTVLPLAELVEVVRVQFPQLRPMLDQYDPLTSPDPELNPANFAGTSFLYRLGWLLVLALLPAACRELAFGGFILSGLARRFHPWTAVLFSAFLFALFQMNVFYFAPHFVFGVVLGLLVVRTGSVAPAVVLYAVLRAWVRAPVLWPEAFPDQSSLGVLPFAPAVRGVVAVGCAVLAAALLGAMLWLGKRPLGAALSSGSRVIQVPAARKTAP